LKGAAGHLKRFGSLTLGDTLSLHVEIVRKQSGPLEAVPELMAVEIVAAWKIDYSAHSSLPLKPLPSGKIIDDG
jgi:hypothetical protein